MSVPYSLAELEAEFVRVGANGGIWHGDVALANAQGLRFLCPQCFGENRGAVGTHSVLTWFRDRGVPDDALPGPGRWEPKGEDLHDLSLFPSINLDVGAPIEVIVSGAKRCNWHGFVTNGSAA